MTLAYWMLNPGQSNNEKVALCVLLVMSWTFVWSMESAKKTAAVDVISMKLLEGARKTNKQIYLGWRSKCFVCNKLHTLLNTIFSNWYPPPWTVWMSWSVNRDHTCGSNFQWRVWWGTKLGKIVHLSSVALSYRSQSSSISPVQSCDTQHQFTQWESCPLVSNLGPF